MANLLILKRAAEAYARLTPAAYEHGETDRYADVGSGPDRLSGLNANSMVGLERFLKAVLSEAPTLASISEWLGMVMEMGVRAIFMLTRLEENGRPKADEYRNYQDSQLTVSCVSVDSTSANFEISNLEITKDGKTNKVVHIWYKGWPDFGLLPSADLFELFRLYDLYASPEEPTLIHCSAGLGRAGTFLATLVGHIKTSKLLKKYYAALRTIACAEDELFAITELYSARARFLDCTIAQLRQTVYAFSADIQSAILTEDKVVEFVNLMRVSRPGIIQNPFQLALCTLALSYPMSLAEGLNALIAEQTRLALLEEAAAEAPTPDVEAAPVDSLAEAP